MYISLLITLVAMAGFSVWFVYKRNNADMESIMTSRINALQGMLQERLRQVEDPEEVRTTAVLAAVEGVFTCTGNGRAGAATMPCTPL